MTVIVADAQTREEIDVVERHWHNSNLCWGDDGANGFEDRGLTPWQLTAAAPGDTFGAEIQIYSGQYGANAFLDLNTMFVTSSQRNDETYLVEFWAGSGLFAAATRVTSHYYRTGGAATEVVPEVARSPRVLGSLNIWARTKCTNVGDSTIDFLLEGHIYPPPNGDEITS